MQTPVSNVLTDHRKIYRVGDITRLIRTTLENEIGKVWVEGEISGFLLHSSGHMYFSLKDTDALIKANLFRGNQRNLKIKPENGMLVRAYGLISAYPVRSEFQMIVEQVEPAGKGNLQEQFEKLKEKLSKEGLFDSSRKKPIPVLPQHVGIVTSPTGAAIRDILNILTRRFPNLHIVIAPVKVQGDGAAQEIVNAIDLFNQRGGIDVMIVGRGGGSLEDLWSFNEEIVARAIARSAIPIISGIGHEIDFTISDFVADLRAPTPSAAAELVVGQKEAFEDRLRGLERHLGHALNGRFLELKNRFTRSSGSYVFREPAHLVKQHVQRIDGLRVKLAGELRGAFSKAQQHVDELSLKLTHRAELAVKTGAQDIRRLDLQLKALSPLAVLERGYSVTRTSSGTIVRSNEDVAKGEKIVTQLAKGVVESIVEKTHGKNG